MLLAKSNKQKLNIRSSTESELIAVDDALTMIQWTKSFMKEQGYDIGTIVKEDNQSTMLLMKNGKLSSRKQTKHSDIRYSYVKDPFEQSVITLEHCVSDEMIADFPAKPLQGKKFQIFTNIILNNHHDNLSALQYRSVLGNITEKENIFY